MSIEKALGTLALGERQSIIMLVSVLPGLFDVAALSKVLGLSSDEGKAFIESMVQAGMLQSAPDHIPPAFVIAPTTREAAS